MYSLSFPNMFSNNGLKTTLYEDHKATYTNLRLMLLSSKSSLFGDPDFGTLLKRRLFEQNNAIVRDIIIDDIYTSILTFMPQISIKREDIKVTSDGIDIFVEIKCINLIDYKLDTYTINLTEQ